jgi:hypothetical protein
VAVTPQEAVKLIGIIKREARRQAKSHENKKHNQLIEQLARDAGFKTYAALRALAKETSNAAL